jgi:hypothetical protein
MSQMETTTSPILLPLIRGEATKLTERMQRILAAWAVKTAMVAEYLDRSHNVTPQAQRTFLMHNKVPSDSWHVWICAYNDKGWKDLMAFQQVANLEVPAVSGPGAVPHYIEFNMFGLGQIIFALAVTSWDVVEPHLAAFDFTGINRIWPTRRTEITWPPDHILNDFEADTLSSFVNEALHLPVDRPTNGTHTD